MRIVTANLQHGHRPPGRPALAAAVPALRALGADVWALQELDRGRRRTRWRHQGEQLAAALDGELLWARAKHWCWAAQGNALVVRGTIADADTVVLPGPGERRVVAVATVVLADGAWSVACTHLSLHGPTARQQLGAALGVLGERPPPRVLVGDLNLVPAAVAPLVDDAGYRLLDGPATVDARAVPSRRLDHVVVQGATFGDSGVTALPVSDHLAAWADLSPEGSPV